MNKLIKCKEYARLSQVPVAGLPHASNFNKTVEIDLKIFKGTIILHMTDHLTRFSSAFVCKLKEPQIIIDGMCKAWIVIFGSPEMSITDNGGEFVNPHFLELSESKNIRILTTAAYSP